MRPLPFIFDPCSAETPAQKKSSIMLLAIMEDAAVR